MVGRGVLFIVKLPEGLHLDFEGDVLEVRDAQDVPHITFAVGAGDPTEWSATIVRRVCEALGITEFWRYHEDDEVPATLDDILADWHDTLGAEDGFLP